MKHILITGTSSGIGLSIANYLHGQGHRVLGTSRNAKNKSFDFQTLPLDVTDDASVKACIQEAIDILGSIDVLINNAGMGISGPAEDTTIEEAKTQFETNYFGVVRMTQAVLGHMRELNKGTIININSFLGIIGSPLQSHYAASKYALRGFTESLRYEISSYDIETTDLILGDFKTNFTTNRNEINRISPHYWSMYDSVMEVIERDEHNGADPILVSKLIAKLLRKKGKLKISYSVASPLQKSLLHLKGLIGDNLFENIAKRVWKL